MSSQEFQETYTQISDVSDRLLSFLQQYRKERLEEGDNTQSLENAEANIKAVTKGLKTQKYEVAIVAPMKAGKSTFLNAIIGADILASESAACTICRTDVRHIAKEETPQLLEYNEQSKKPLIIAQGNAHDIHEEFLNRTRQLRSDLGNQHPVPTQFELLYPIEAIENLPALSGFTLIDTPGPNEWKSMSIDTVALKQVSLEALRTCKAVLFILNYRSFKDKAVDELFKSITENRQELLLNNSSRIFFILNQVDLRSEKDPEISETIALLKRELTNFGFPNPIIYPVSALQGLLAKLIQQNLATENQIKDFKKFFSARYARENEDGDMITPAPQKIAAQAIADSGIIAVQEAVFQTVVQSSGWILLHDAINMLENAAKSIENTINTQISGWEMEISSLKAKVEEYKSRSESAKDKVKSVKKSIEKQKELLLDGFSAGIDAFTESAKEKISHEIQAIVQSRAGNHSQKKLKNPEQSNGILNAENKLIGFFQLLNFLPNFGQEWSKIFTVGSSLFDHLRDGIPQIFTNVSLGSNYNLNPNIIRCNSIEEAQKTKEVINNFCAPHVQSWWLDTQDRLIYQGTKIREELVKNICDDIQSISDELSDYLGTALQVDININTIQFPSFQFPGIDAQIRYQQEVYKRSIKEQRTRGRCCDSDEVYYIDVPVEESRSFYDIDLKETERLIISKLEQQSTINKDLLRRVIKKQIDEDFHQAEKQIFDYINQFQMEFEKLLIKRTQKELDSVKVLDSLRISYEDLYLYLEELETLKKSLLTWKF